MLGKEKVLAKWWKGFIEITLESGDVVLKGRDWEIAFSNREIYVDSIKYSREEYELGRSGRVLGKTIVFRFSDRMAGKPSNVKGLTNSTLWKDVLSSFEVRYTPLDPVEWIVTIIPLYARIWDYVIVSTRLLLVRTISRRRFFIHDFGDSSTIYFI